MSEIRRIAAYMQPNLDELVAVWLARRFFNADEPWEVVFFPRGHPAYKEDVVWCVAPGNAAALEIIWERKRPTFVERYAMSAAGCVWARLLHMGKPVAHLVDLVDAVHANALSYGDAPVDSVWAGLWDELRTTWERAEAQSANDLELYETLHHWLEEYEDSLGLGAVVPLDWKREASRLPKETGAYAMILETKAPGSVLIGRQGALGRMDVKPGFYVYIGSACQRGGVRARWQHHLKRALELALKWQVDFLRLRCSVVEARSARIQLIEESELR